MRYTRFYNNNYKTGNDKISEIALTTLAIYLATLKNFRQYKKLHFSITSDI